ncbi:MAG: hypothetical protein EOO13_01660 [Chitinophagaceae bacterium]|nr:MAG: hypothetical protein EOO13_01660 [Chitinophagaceae bacterium]
MMYESKRQGLAPKHIYYHRLKKNIFFAAIVLITSLIIGILGYKLTIPQFDWYDSLLNASMILSGMGPVIDPAITLTKSAKVFASVYALFSGVSFLSVFSIVIAPVLHRLFHKFHLDDTGK